MWSKSSTIRRPVVAEGGYWVWPTSIPVGDQGSHHPVPVVMMISWAVPHHRWAAKVRVRQNVKNHHRLDLRKSRRKNQQVCVKRTQNQLVIHMIALPPGPSQCTLRGDRKCLGTRLFRWKGDNLVEIYNVTSFRSQLHEHYIEYVHLLSMCMIYACSSNSAADRLTQLPGRPKDVWRISWTLSGKRSVISRGDFLCFTQRWSLCKAVTSLLLQTLV